MTLAVIVNILTQLGLLTSSYVCVKTTLRMMREHDAQSAELARLRETNRLLARCLVREILRHRRAPGDTQHSLVER